MEIRRPPRLPIPNSGGSLPPIPQDWRLWSGEQLGKRWASGGVGKDRGPIGSTIMNSSYHVLVELVIIFLRKHLEPTVRICLRSSKSIDGRLLADVWPSRSILAISVAPLSADTQSTRSLVDLPSSLSSNTGRPELRPEWEWWRNDLTQTTGRWARQPRDGFHLEWVE